MYYICIGHEDLSRTTDALNLANYINWTGSVDLKIQTQAEDMARQAGAFANPPSPNKLWKNWHACVFFHNIRIYWTIINSNGIVISLAATCQVVLIPLTLS